MKVYVHPQIPDKWHGINKLVIVIVIVIARFVDTFRGCRCDALRHSAKLSANARQDAYFLIFTRSEF